MIPFTCNYFEKLSKFSNLLLRLLISGKLGISTEKQCSSNLLNPAGSLPRLVDVLVRELGQLRDPLPDVEAVRISLLAEHDGAVDAEILEGKKVQAIEAWLRRLN